MIRNKDLKKRIFDISYKHNLSHIGSCITAVDIINDVYNSKENHERFVLSQGHAGLALYTVLEKFKGVDAEKLLESSGTHPDRLNGLGYIDCSTGSLGQGLPIAVGIALANRYRTIHCLISDGEMAEGSTLEALRIKSEQRLRNLRVYLNANGWSAYGKVDVMRAELALPDDVDVRYTDADQNKFPCLKGLAGHYYKLTDYDYRQALRILE